jgi:transposase InsO family protein
VKYAFIHAHDQEFRVCGMCRVLGVSRSGYYAWRERPVSPRSQANQQLVGEIRRVHAAARGVYGALKTWQQLRAQGIGCGRHRVARLRRLYGIEATRRRRFKITTHSRTGQGITPDLVQRGFTVPAPNRVWVGDVTCVPTREGWLYVAVLLDLYSRKVVGWAMSERINTALVLRALRMALVARRPAPGLIHHTDRGAIYAAQEYRAQLTRHGLAPSMGRTGDCYDNAVAESFFSTVKNELTVEQRYASRRDAQTALFEYIEAFYNRQRIHQTLGYRTPQHIEEQALSHN